MVHKLIMVSAAALSLAACNSLGSAWTPDGTSGSSGGGQYSSGASGSSSPSAYSPTGADRIGRAGVIGGIDNGEYPGVAQGWSPQAGSSGGVSDGPPTGIANNQMDRLGE